MNEETFHDLVSGRRRGLLANAIRMALYVGQIPYGVVVAYRNWRYDHLSQAVSSADVPVVSVGNLTVGGTGKTPMVKWIARQLRAKQVRVAILSRGYGAEAGAVNDEAIELEEALPDVPHLQDPHRVLSAQIAVEELESQLLLLDDGFQHRKLARDLDIVLLDATCPFGYGRLLPSGLLREPLRSLKRADVVCLTRSDQVAAEARRDIAATVRRFAPAALWCEAAHRPTRLINADGQSAPLSELENRQVAAFCGIGNPQAFRNSLMQAGANVRHWSAFADHYRYQREDVEQLAQAADGMELAVCTHKDLAKLQVSKLGETPLWALEVDMHFSYGEQELCQRLAALLPEQTMAV